MKRDGSCRRCGSDGTSPDLDRWVAVLRWLCPPPPVPGFYDWCKQAGYEIDESREAWGLWRTAVNQVRARHNAAAALIAQERRRAWLEVNHIDPVLGRHGESGCWHHLDGLEVLCHACHLAETARQRAAGLLARPRPETDQTIP